MPSPGPGLVGCDLVRKTASPTATFFLCAFINAAVSMMIPRAGSRLPHRFITILSGSRRSSDIQTLQRQPRRHRKVETLPNLLITKIKYVHMMPFKGDPQENFGREKSSPCRFRLHCNPHGLADLSLPELSSNSRRQTPEALHTLRAGFHHSYLPQKGLYVKLMGKSLTRC
jgi:hypothetical protein